MPPFTPRPLLPRLSCSARSAADPHGARRGCLAGL